MQRPAAVSTLNTTDLQTTDQKEHEEQSNGEVTLIYSQEAGTQIIQHQDSLTDYLSISSSCSMELPRSDSSSSAALGSVTSSTLQPPVDRGETDRDQVQIRDQDLDQDLDQDQDQQASTGPECDVNSAGTFIPKLPKLQAFTVLSVNGTLWIPRCVSPHRLSTKT